MCTKQNKQREEAGRTDVYPYRTVGCHVWMLRLARAWRCQIQGARENARRQSLRTKSNTHTSHDNVHAVNTYLHAAPSRLGRPCVYVCHIEHNKVTDRQLRYMYSMTAFVAAEHARHVCVMEVRSDVQGKDT